MPALVYVSSFIGGDALKCICMHFAAWEQPELFAKELRAAFRTLR
ncbi:hypothetical protein J2Y86_001262 [Pseudomonas migulae]|nr:hypothetical protein [Pseudomonas migulae]MCP1496555.1 hypothetical protein [Pseudomonas migulae]